MIKGLYAAASAMLANLTRQGLLTHNVSNLNTPGFKQVLVSLDDFVETNVVVPPGPTAGSTPLRYIGTVGLGVESAPETIDFTAGGLRQTGQPLDLALQGSDGFFRVQTPSGERFTRDGRFIRDTQGSLVTVDGYKVLNDGGQPITLPEGDVNIGPDGTITVNGAAAGKLGIMYFADPSTQLTRDLPNTYTGAGGTTTPAAGQTGSSVAQGYLEMSNANPAQLMTQMVAVSRAYEAAQKMVQNEDELLGKAISSLGRF